MSERDQLESTSNDAVISALRTERADCCLQDEGACEVHAAMEQGAWLGQVQTLAVLDQQGWPNPHALSGARARADAFESLYLEAKAERDAALREAARYEPIDGWCWDGFWFHRRGDDCGKFCMPIARQVTEGGGS